MSKPVTVLTSYDESMGYFPPVEIMERDGDPDYGHVMTHVRIGGIEYAMPEGSAVLIESAADELTRVSLTILAGSVSVDHERVTDRRPIIVTESGVQ